MRYYFLQVMVGELPGDFLRLDARTTSQQQQSMADERVAQILQAQQQAGYGVIPSNIRGKLNISVVQVSVLTTSRQAMVSYHQISGEN